MNKLFKRYALIVSCSLVILMSCQGSSELSLDFQCGGSISNLEDVADFENKFSMPIPKDWKVNLYYDSAQSSIYFADTTKQLTETTIVDVTFIKQKTNFDAAFLSNVQTNYVNAALKEEKNKTFSLNDYPSYYTVAKGIRNNFPYTICNVFINTMGDGTFIHAKLEVYGDSLVEQRLCKGIDLVEKIRFK
ncbi:hypothetical protein RQM59_05550 [Flavobacteriaceae bacterium S356]|uniref:Lipoprotein n=1 Tax=Asprobacillus argus TaxID=3076534 RepID=A0ABU3LDP7_9FLAO|nr:hypothetical protein [Flavobacteriaceae bacterium S356]